MDYPSYMAEHRRLTVLRILSEAPGYSANESLLHDMVERFAHRCTRDQVRTDLAWLRDQGLLTLEELGGLMIATVTKTGVDAARGRSTVPGVKRPSPEG